MNLITLNEQQSNEFYLLSNMNNFFSIQLDHIDPLKILMEEGTLQNMEENLEVNAKTEKLMSSMNEVIAFSVESLVKKIMQGYTLTTRKVFENYDCMKKADINTCNEDAIQKTFKLTNFQQKDIEIITNKATEFKLEYQVIHDKIHVSGTQTVLFEFVLWLYEFLNMCTMMQKHDFAHDEVSISTFHRLHKEDIINKANGLKITCDFRYHIILMTGLSQSLKEFKNYLHQVETSAKKALYPKYWDLEDQSVYSEIEVCPRSTEFEEIDFSVKLTLPNAKIIKLTRIQNNYLMTQYITNLNMRQEVRGGPLNRRLLFHGTRELDPKKIYKNFDTGFDLQFASQSGLFGKGLYFAQNAIYSHGYRFATRNKTFQMILADVFVGKSRHLSSKNNSHLIKAPEGYDSVFSSKEFFIIYNNFHSYPLYLIEYEITEAPTPSTSETQNTPNTTQTSIFSLGSAPVSTVPNNTSASNPSKALTYPPNSKHDDKTQKITKPAYNQKLSPIATKRVQDELAELQADQSLDYLFIELPEETDPSKWIVSIIGPPYSAYEGGLFKVEIVFPWNYPLTPPTITFKTQIYHPSIDTHGKVCLGAISNWTPVLDLRQVILTLSAILDNPSIEEPLMIDISAQYRKNPQEFMRNARLWTEKYANQQ